MANRWWVYQRERFPVLVHGPLIAALSFGALSVSSVLRGQARLPEAGSFLVAFASTFLLFLQLRIADEFKDRTRITLPRLPPRPPRPSHFARTGARGRPRSVPAARAGALAARPGAAARACLALPGPDVEEIFAREYLTTHPITYLSTHMLILPLTTLYATACEWRTASTSPPVGSPGCSWPLLQRARCRISRKIRAPETRRPGWKPTPPFSGRRTATLAW